MGPSVKPVARGVAPAGRAGRKNGPLSRGNPLIAPSWFFSFAIFSLFFALTPFLGTIWPPEIINVFFSFRFRFFRGFFVLCAEPPRAPHLPALQNSPFADLLAFVLSAIECFFSAPSLLGATPDPKYRGEITLSGGPLFGSRFRKIEGLKTAFFFARGQVPTRRRVAACSVFPVTTCFYSLSTLTAALLRRTSE